MSKELSPIVIYQIFKSKYLAKYEFSTGETLTYDAQCISMYSLLGYILFHCYYTAVACKNSHGVSMAYKLSMAYFSRTGTFFVFFSKICKLECNTTQLLIG